MRPRYAHPNTCCPASGRAGHGPRVAVIAGLVGMAARMPKTAAVHTGMVTESVVA